MKRFIALTALGLTLAAAPVMAQGNACPPGLAKKGTGCQPPGLAKKQGLYHPGDRIDRNYDVLRNPGRYGLNPNETYYRVGDRIYRVDRDTRKVLDLIGAAAAILN